MKRVAVAVVGCGAFGRNHARVYARLPEAELVGVFDADAARAQAIAKEFGTRSLASLEEVAATAAAASLAVPTHLHASVGLELLRQGVDLLVEKPIATSLEEADALSTCAQRHDRVLQVGHLERFNPSVQLVRPRLSNPLFFEVHRLSVFTARSLDVDVLLDLMIHDLDLVLSFVKAPLERIDAVGLPVLTGKVDIANVRMSFENGCVANLTASRVSTEKVRKLRFFQPGEYVSLDFARQDAHVFRLKQQAVGGGLPPEVLASLLRQSVPTAGFDHPLARQAQQPLAQLMSEAGIEHLHLKPEGPAEPLESELRAFVQAVRQRSTPEVGAEEGRAALAAALQARQALEAHAAKLGLH